MTPRRVHVPYRVPYADTDQMGVVYYGNYLTYFERARNELLRALGFTYRKLESLGYGLPVTEAHVDYRAPAHYDDSLDIQGWVGWVQRVRVRVDCAVYCEDRLLAEGYTVHAVLDLEKRRPTRLPQHIAALMQASPGDSSETEI